MISKDNNDGFLIDAVKLTKKFGDITALDEVSFFLNKREVFGFLGPNGAGKTTTINILTGLSRADSGRISVAGLDCTKNPKAAQHLIGIVPDESNLYPELTGFDNLCFCASLYGIRKEERKKRAAELLDLFGLKQAGGRKFAGYSKGMKRKLTIAAGIIHHPQILFLDEPTTGIDVASARQIRQLISELPEKGTTIFLTTHYIEEAERLCDRIAFIVNGKIVRTDTVENLLQPVKGKQIMLLSVQGAAGKASAVLADAFPDFNFQYVSTDQIRIEAGTDIHLAPFVRLLDEHGIELNEAKRQVPTLEDIFVNVTGIEAKILRKESDKKRGQA
ncbi:MAG: ATP-binding cassette domain-containing protein [Spirochaetes bacterium]|nr:ATP-binding cassette domain-containing protein [Spirochaetota bacterium]